MSGIDITLPSEYHRFQAEKLGGEAHIYGSGERWLCPVSVCNAPWGFGEPVWINEQPVTWMARRLDGSPVTCRWGKFKNRELAGNALCLQPQGVPNHFSAPGPVRFAQLFLPNALIDRVGGELRSSGLASQALREDLVSLVDPDLDHQYVAYLEAASSLSTRLELEARAILFVSRLLRAHHGLSGPASRGTGGLSPRQIRRVCETMEAYLGCDIALEALAKIAGVSATHFSRAFKQSMGMPPFAWLLQRRIERAKELLEKSTMPLAEIALAVGFAAQPQFTTAFRRITGMTPGAWRRERFL